MFNHFCSWLEARGLAFHQAGAPDLELFLDSQVTGEGEKKHHRRAYIHLLERAYARMIQLGWAGHNPARTAALRGAGAGRNKATQFLSEAERRQLIRHIEAWQGENSQDEDAEEEWIERRDRAMAAIILGAGLKVSEMRQVSFNCMDARGEAIRIGYGPTARTVYLLPFARPVLADWRQCHRDLALPVKTLFPAMTMGPRRRADARPDAAMHQATIHRRINRLLANAGINLAQSDPDAAARLCAQTLRNTYAAQLIDEGRDDEAVAVALGITKPTAERLRRAYQGSCHVRPHHP